MLLESVSYARASTVAEALELLSQRDGAAALAGGQSLINVLKHRVASVELLVDIGRVQELRSIERHADGTLRIGACVTYDELDHSEEVRAGHRLLAEVAGHIEDQQIRNRGTIGGNCCLSDPTNNLPPLLVALGATMTIAGPRGRREVPAESFFHGYFATEVGPGELLTHISVPPLGADAGVGYSTVAIGADSKALARAAALVHAGEQIDEARVVLACLGPAPLRHAAVEAALRGAPTTAEAVQTAVAAIDGDLSPAPDVHASPEYRIEMARVATRRAVCQAIGKVG